MGQKGDSMSDILARIEAKKADMKTARNNMALGIKYSSRSLGGHTTQYRKLMREAGLEIVVISTPKVTPQVGKPCRYKACKGRDHKAHGEKCPVASARGKTGGTNGLGDVKARVGSLNGRFTGFRECGCPQRQHLPTCHKAGLSAAKIALINEAVSIKKIININPITWRYTADCITTEAVSFMLKGIAGVCAGCDTEMLAIKASKVNKNDIREARMRVICDACEAQ